MTHHLFKKSTKSLINSLRRCLLTSTMAKSKFEYVKQFENDRVCLPNCWIVVRVDGKNFSKFSKVHEFMKPNDIRALELMNQAATAIMNEFTEIIFAFGQSDEYSFVFKKDTQLYNRRESKLVSYINSLFTSAYVFNWCKYFESTPLKYPPSFDARAILYPSKQNLRDYLSWRQADVHINNLYNTCFWNLVQNKKLTCAQAQNTLKGSMSSDKNELLFREFGINYNNEPHIFRKGTVLIRSPPSHDNSKTKPTILSVHNDIIGERFWNENPEILTEKISTTAMNKMKKLENLKNNDENETILVKVRIENDS